MLTLSLGDPSINTHYIVHLIEHVRNRVNAEAFMLDFGAGRVFTEDEVLYLGVILRFQRPENVNLNGGIWEQYLVQVSPFLDGLTFFGIPDHLVPLHMYPTENSQNLFDQGRKWSPIATALLFALAGLGDMGRGMNAALNAPPAKPKVNYNDVRNIANQGRTVDDILRESRPGETTMGRTTQFENPGGLSRANIDFDSLNPTNVRNINTPWGPGRVGTLQDGRTVTVRPGSSGMHPTLEVINQNGRYIKIRYGG